MCNCEGWMGEFLRRYRSGECEQVWAELVALGEAVRSPTLLPDARGVARETMERARSNIDTLVRRLRDLQYTFVADAAVVEPAPDVPQAIAALEGRVGPIPLSLCAWWEVGGSADLRGTHPAWPDPRTWRYPDPLVLLPIEEALVDLNDYVYSEFNHAPPPGAQYPLTIAPDDAHKADVSGGEPYSIMVPAATADALLREEWHETTLVNYLRICFRWGGFPGFARYPERPTELLSFLAHGLAAV